MAQEAMKVDLQCPREAAIKGVTCGGRHTYIWLTNGKLYSFGNNFFAQLGYDFHLATYKDNQVRTFIIYILYYFIISRFNTYDYDL